MSAIIFKATIPKLGDGIRLSLCCRAFLKEEYYMYVCIKCGGVVGRR